MRIAIYVKNKDVYICPTNKTKSGFYLDCEPRFVVSGQEDCRNIGAKLAEALDASIGIVPDPVSFKEEQNIFYKHSKTKNWKAFAKDARYFSIEIRDGNGILTQYYPADARGGFREKDTNTMGASTSSLTDFSLLVCENIKRLCGI